MSTRIEIKSAYVDHDDPEDIIIHAKNGKTYLMHKKEAEKIIKLKD